jgi:hypothetical protein
LAWACTTWAPAAEAWALACSTWASACAICCCGAGDLGLDLLDLHALVGRIQLGSTSPALTIWLSSNSTLVTTPGCAPTPGARGR